jgi:predicted ATPase
LRRSPLVLILDDLHWIESSASLLFHGGSKSRILIICTYRPEDVASREPVAPSAAEHDRRIEAPVATSSSSSVRSPARGPAVRRR